MVKRQIKIIGIGLGSPGHLTGHAIEALRQVDVFLVADKGDIKKEMVAARKAICEAFLKPGSYRFVTISDTDRGPDAKRGSAEYRKGVQAWRQSRVNRFVNAIKELPPNMIVGFLAWGDPAFYDSLIGIVEEIGEIIPLDVRVIPGISAIQALAAENVICLNRVAAPIHITTGRRLLREWSAELGTVVVMLDKGLACAQLVARAPDLEIIWGAYIGFPWQIIRRGRLADMVQELIPLRKKLRQEHGWMMDTYILRGPEMTDDAPPLET
nr:precorrin-6A synthase (deacetylating) [uncultured Desulfobacter sp.]